MTEENQEGVYNPGAQEKERIQFVLNEYDDMFKKRSYTYPQFNDRTLIEFIDDSEKRLNAYVLSRESQGKESWQSNFATRAYANKAKALLAATARDIPDMKFKAVTKDNAFDYFAADSMKYLVTYSYQKGNPAVDLFFLGWSLVGHGTVISYEGFGQHKFKKKTIKSFDVITGDVEFDEVDETTLGEPVSFEIPLENLLIKNFYINDIQEQPGIIWWTYYADKDRFDLEWGKYKNAKHVKNTRDITVEENETYFHNAWKENIESGNGYLVMRYMGVYKDTYRVIANGVELYDGPMLWTSLDPDDKGKKVYPFAKEIMEPFAQGKNFFYGNSSPNAAMGEGDTLNTLYNSALDKTYRAMVPPLLIGVINKDQLDLEDEIVAGDTKIYVDDINQVKQMDIRGVTDADLAMIRLISTGLDLTTLDPSQQGVAEKYVTARAAVAADERARQLKGLFFMFLESLWLQKTRLRMGNILLSYTQPQYEEVLGENGSKKLIEKFRSFNVDNAELSDGSRGTMAIQLVGNRSELSELKPRIEEEEARHKVMGKPFEKIGMMYNFLQRFGFYVHVLPATLWQSSQALAMAMVLEKVTTFAKLFPQFFVTNQNELIKDILRQYDDSPEKYQFPQAQQPQPEEGEEGGKGGAGGLIGDLTMSDSNNSLAKLTGVSQ